MSRKHKSRSGSKTQNDRWLGIVLGLCIFVVVAVVCEYVGVPLYIRPFSLYACVFAGLMYVFFKQYGTRLWFWLTMTMITIAHLPILIVFAGPIDRASPALTIPVTLLDGVIFVMALVFIADQFEKRRGAKHL